MKALSLRQPWAWLVVHGGKIIENRKWNTSFRGTFLIHASRGMTQAEYDKAMMFAKKVNSELEPMPFAWLYRGGIIGSAKLVNVIPPCNTEGGDWLPCKCGNQWHMGEQYGFVLEDIKPLPFKECKGALNFFEVAA